MVEEEVMERAQNTHHNEITTKATQANHNQTKNKKATIQRDNRCHRQGKGSRTNAGRDKERVEETR